MSRKNSSTCTEKEYVDDKFLPRTNRKLSCELVETDLDLLFINNNEDENVSEDNSTTTADDKPSGREHWSSHSEFLLSMVGFCVGLGNLWRFPYLCMRNGGGAFLIPFIIVLLTCGLPLYFLELCLGQFAGVGTMHAWSVCPLLKGIGVGMVLICGLCSFYYNIIMAWAIYYIGNSFLDPLPWSTCDNSWNSPGCISNRGRSNETLFPYGTLNDTARDSPFNNSMYVLNTSVPNSNATLGPLQTPEEDFWQYNVLRLSPGLDVMGVIPVHMGLCFFGAWILIFLCLIRGIRSLGKVVYVTAILPYVLLTVLLIRGATLPGSYDGVIFYIKPDFSKLTNMQVWIEAAIQVFYSLGACWGGIITMASHNKFNNNCLRDSIMLAFISEGTSVYGGFAIFTILGFMAHEANMTIPEIAKSGPGLGFIAYPEALARLPLPQFWSVLFFIMLLTVGLDSQFGMMEAVCIAITDSWPKLKKWRMLLTGGVCGLLFLLGLPICTEGGMYIFQLLDWYVATLAIPVFGITECVLFGWIYGAERFSRDVELMIGRPVPVFMRVCWCFITPTILLSCLLFTLAKYKPPTYGDYVYPDYANVIGWTITLIPVLPIPIFMGLELWKASGNTIIEKLKNSTRPSANWARDVKSKEYETPPEVSVWKTVSINICGPRNK